MLGVTANERSRAKHGHDEPGQIAVITGERSRRMKGPGQTASRMKERPQGAQADDGGWPTTGEPGRRRVRAARRCPQGRRAAGVQHGQGDSSPSTFPADGCPPSCSLLLLLPIARLCCLSRACWLLLFGSRTLLFIEFIFSLSENEETLRRGTLTPNRRLSRRKHKNAEKRSTAVDADADANAEGRVVDVKSMTQTDAGRRREVQGWRAVRSLKEKPEDQGIARSGLT